MISFVAIVAEAPRVFYACCPLRSSRNDLSTTLHYFFSRSSSPDGADPTAPVRRLPPPRRGRGAVGCGARADLEFCKFLAGSFSAVSKRIFAIKYAFGSIFQALQDLHSFAPLQSQNFRKNRFEKTAIFVKFQQKVANVAKFAKFCQISKISA